jgi:hypothetical protein
MPSISGFTTPPNHSDKAQLDGMSSELEKENIAEGLVAPTAAKNDAPSSVKASKKSRSLSMGPGALNVPLKEDSGNRRKVLTSALVCDYIN